MYFRRILLGAMVLGLTATLASAFTASCRILSSRWVAGQLCIETQCVLTVSPSDCDADPDMLINVNVTFFDSDVAFNDPAGSATYTVDATDACAKARAKSKPVRIVIEKRHCFSGLLPSSFGETEIELFGAYSVGFGTTVVTENTDNHPTTHRPGLAPAED